jgi:hypothetical protein
VGRSIGTVPSTRVDVEELESTRSETVLAVVLTVFLLIGVLWTYARIDDLARNSIAPAQMSARERSATDRLEAANLQLFSAQSADAQARRDLELAREAYRTALDAGQKAPELRNAYEQAQARYAQSQLRVGAARATAAAAEPGAQRAEESFGRRVQDAERGQAWIAAGLRLAFTAALLVLGYLLLARMRRERTRYLPVAFAVIATAAILALVLAGDYVTDYVDPLELGPLVLSLFGVAATLVAFAALQRYLARRVPVNRVRKGECPFCGYPVRAGGSHCEGCGREVVAECATCGNPRRVGTAHCPACGAA